MCKDKPIESLTTKHHTIHIEYDADPLDPRTENDNPDTMLCFHDRHKLGDEHEYKTSESFFIELLADLPMPALTAVATTLTVFLTDSHGTPLNYDRLRDAVENAIRYEIGFTPDVVGAITDAYPFPILPLYLYDHSGLSISTGSFSCRWDSGQVGWIYMTPKQVEDFGFPADQSPTERRDAIIKVLEASVEEYDDYLTGQCFSYSIYRNSDTDFDNCVESCGGFLGDIDFVIAEAKSAAIRLDSIIDARELQLTGPNGAD